MVVLVMKYADRVKAEKAATELQDLLAENKRHAKYDLGSSVWAVGMTASKFFSAFDSANKFRKGYKGKKWKPRKIDYGVAPIQLEIVLTWIAKVYIDMKAAMKEGSNTLWFVNQNKGDQMFMTMAEKRKAAEEPRGCMYWAMKKYREGMNHFKATGETQWLPSFVYFL
jgi:hypothetical protein